MALTKCDLANNLYLQCDVLQNESQKIIESLIEIIKSTLESGEDVLVSGFGKFYILDKKNRRGRNPATGNDLMLGARKTVSFRCSNKLREKVNSSE